ncbi:hypothetical protein [Streptomyces roseifaciens]|uniref:hypothetical protein n=1 Tax=Streptomyces roseifaciens TaxID=1488406 RepID=UPI000717FEBE|nr:hypothetical protein [Streptomyces roseifaciens]
MFEMCAICDPDDAGRVQQSLTSAFATEAVRTAPARGGDRVRLNLTAAHRNDSHPAYRDAPSLLREMFDVLEMGLEVDPADEDVSESTWAYRVRRAALLDRIALQEAATCPPGIAAEAAETAEIAAWALAVLGHMYGSGPDAGVREWPRDYVRHQYTVYRLRDCACDGPCPVHPNPDL